MPLFSEIVPSVLALAAVCAAVILATGAKGILDGLGAMPREWDRGGEPSAETDEDPDGVSKTHIFHSEDSDYARQKILILYGGEIVETTLFDYLCATVAAEMPMSYGTEAIKAQAAVSYTYLVRRLERGLGSDPVHKGAWICGDSSHCQAFLPKEKAAEKWEAWYFERYWPKLEEAVRDALGMLITYGGKTIDAVCHSTSPGRTENAEDVWGSHIPYLVSVDSPWDLEDPKYSVEKAVSADEVGRTLKEAFGLKSLPADPETWFTMETFSAAGGITKMYACGEPTTGRAVRKLFGLRSAAFTLTYADGMFTFTTRGYGHGVGMSQYGAGKMAALGYSAEEIIKHYYTGVEVEWDSRIFAEG